MGATIPARLHNPALEYAIRVANDLDQLIVVGFGVMDDYSEANARHCAFMLERQRDVDWEPIAIRTDATMMNENDTLKLWQPRTCHVLTCEDARDIGRNFAKFLMTLVDWESAAEPSRARIGSTTST